MASRRRSPKRKSTKAVASKRRWPKKSATTVAHKANIKEIIMATDKEEVLELLKLYDATVGHPNCDKIGALALLELKRLNKEAAKELEAEMKKDKEEEEAEAAKKAADEKAVRDKEAKAAEAGHKSADKGK